MEWHDRAIVLGVRRHGERSTIVEVLSEHHGRHAGLTRASKTLGGALQPGSDLDLTWRARLADHLGTFTIETARVRLGALIDHPARLAALSAAALASQMLLPEREPHPRVFAGMSVLLDALERDEHWPAMFVRFELGLLSDLGFGLDLDRCALTGVLDDLAYVSPRTGRAVSRLAGEPWAERLLGLPDFLAGRLGEAVAIDEVLAGLRLTGHFLERQLAEGPRAKVIEARGRLTQALRTL